MNDELVVFVYIHEGLLENIQVNNPAIKVLLVDEDPEADERKIIIGDPYGTEIATVQEMRATIDHWKDEQDKETWLECCYEAAGAIEYSKAPGYRAIPPEDQQALAEWLKADPELLDLLTSEIVTRWNNHKDESEPPDYESWADGLIETSRLMSSNAFTIIPPEDRDALIEWLKTDPSLGNLPGGTVVSMWFDRPGR